MRVTSGRTLVAVGLGLLLSTGPIRAQQGSGRADPALASAVAAPGRSPKFLDRDASRHPLELLVFSGVTSTSTVIEVWPAGGYWTEILAPYLKDGGVYYAAVEAEPTSSPDHDAAARRSGYFMRRLSEDPILFAGVRVTELGPGRDAPAPPGSADVVLSVDDLHVWMKQGFAEDALVDIFKSLKPGGVLVLEDHRGHGVGEQDLQAATGYVREDYAKGLAQLAGFEFVATSALAANPKDTGNWPRGAWTLPPIFALGQQDRAVYAAVGEPDDFVLKFRKPL